MNVRRPTLAAGALLLLASLARCGADSSPWSASASPTPAASPTPTASPSPTPLPEGTSRFTFASTTVGDSFEVFVAVPERYATEADARYPVVYLLDANWNFEPVRGVIATLVSQGQMEPVILVSLCPVQAFQPGYGGTAPSRCRDLTPTAIASFPGSGHASRFAGFLREELVPYVDAVYRTRASADARCLVGHSLAGLFTWYAALHLDETFQKFIPASASLWWDNRVLFRDEADYARAHDDLRLLAYATVSTGEGPDMLRDRDDFVQQLRARNYPGLRIVTATYDGIPHDQSSGPAFREGLAELF
jgi:predicted alpha/beta superfamily hydrolase